MHLKILIYQQRKTGCEICFCAALRIVPMLTMRRSSAVIEHIKQCRIECEYDRLIRGAVNV